MGSRFRCLFQSLGFLLLVSCSSTSVNSGGTGGGGAGGTGGSGGTTGGTSGTGASTGGGGAAGGGAAGSGGVSGSGGSAGVNLHSAIQWNGDCSTNGSPPTKIGFGGSPQPFTVELWYLIDVDKGLSQRLFAMGGSAANDPGWMLEITATRQLAFCTADGASRTCGTTTQTLAVGKNYHLAVVHDALGANTLYVRGPTDPAHVATPLSTQMPTAWTPGSKFELSACSAGKAFGTMDAVMIWAEARSAIQLDNDAHTDQPCSGTALAASFNFDNLSGNQITDCAGSGLYQNIDATLYKQIPSPF